MNWTQSVASRGLPERNAAESWQARVYYFSLSDAAFWKKGSGAKKRASKCVEKGYLGKLVKTIIHQGKSSPATIY